MPKQCPSYGKLHAARLEAELCYLRQGLDNKSANVTEKGGKPMLELLCGISGAFRPGFMTCLMGVSGAGEQALQLLFTSASAT